MNWLDLLRYLVVLQASFAVGLTSAVVWAYLRGVRGWAPQVVQLTVAFDILVGIAAWSEFARIGTPELGWYAPVKAAALALATWALVGLFRLRPGHAR